MSRKRQQVRLVILTIVSLSLSNRLACPSCCCVVRARGRRYLEFEKPDTWFSFVDMAHLQAKLISQEAQYEIDNKAFDLPGEVKVEDLSNLVNKFLKEKYDGEARKDDEESEFKAVEFDFLIDGEFLRTPLNEYVELKGLSTESVIPIEYILKQEGPKPEVEFAEDDWISGVQSLGDYILTGSYDSGITIRHTDKEEKIVRGIGHTQPVKSVSWVGCKDETYYAISTSQDQSAILWQWKTEDDTMKPLFWCRGHSQSVECVAVHPTEETFVTGSWDASIKLWSTSPTPQEDSNEQEDYEKARNKKKRQRIGQRGVTRVPKYTLAGHTESVSGLAWLSDSELCSVSWDHTIRIWDMNKLKEKGRLQGAKVFLACDYSQENNLLVTGNSDRHIRIWDPRNKSEYGSEASIVKQSLSSHTGWVTCVKWSPSNSNQLVSGSLDFEVKLWDIRSTKTSLYDIEGHRDKVLCLDWTNPGVILSGGADKTLYKYRLSSK